jgi:glycosyltransferase involved in cell wall biosynthesis
MDYAYTIQSKMGIPVVIVNDAGMNLKRFPYMRFGMEFRYKSEYNDFTKMVYKDTVFGFYQVSTAMLDVHEVETLVYNIKMLSPRLVLNVGASCLTADLCRHFAKTASIPCAISIPTSMADYLVLCRELRLADQQNLEAMQPWQKLIQSVYNYIMPDADTMSSYCRRDFEIEEEDWLIVTVGNRMQEEMDDDFLAMVDNVLGELPDSHFLIIGGIRDQSVIADKFVNRQRVHFAGAILDGSQAIRLADVYIHPTRKGGGRAAFEALYYGVPVITTKYGDTWDTCGKQFGVESYQEMKERLEGYYYDQEVYDHMRQISRARGLELEDVRGMFEKLFSDLDVEYP